MGNDTKHINIGLYLWTEHAKILRDAASLKGLNVQEYIREKTLASAASELGIPLPELPYQRRGNVASDKIARLEEAASAILVELENLKKRTRPSGVYSTRPETEAKKRSG